ncbi:MAG: homoserine O-succinyltransferase [Lachnospiraceae bacterium]|nr:homoserine O-succinyltransferase [Lachnospiraceae bacterium]
MPIKIQDSLPAQKTLEGENIFVMTEYRAMHQDIRPLHVLVLNLMPAKIETETQLLRKLSNTPLQVEVEFMQTASYQPRHVEASHLDTFYTVFDEVKNRNFDGMIITGAPLDHKKFEDVSYWPELCQIMEWSRTHVHCTLHMCWGTYAALYYHYGIDKVNLEKKLSGVYEHHVMKKNSPLFRGFDDVFYAPQSRAMTVPREEIEKVPELELLACSDEAGVTIVKTRDSRQFFITCHPEYDSDTLAREYFRDKKKGMNPDLPVNYFPGNDPERPPVVRWRSAGQLLYSNWLNYYVYQSTPYDVKQIAGENNEDK